jgi:hypothetical protein
VTQGLPPKPTCASIIAGIMLAVIVLAAFAFLPNLVKWVGAVFTFLPGQLGLIQVVGPDDVLPVDMTDSPTTVTFARPGEYALFTANLDLLSINEAILAAKAKPWFRLADSNGSQIAVTMIERGLAFYDTPFARGRPVARFEVLDPGPYTMTHPRRPDFVYLVPDYTRGKEDAIGMYMLLQAAALAAGVWYLRRKTRKPLVVIKPPPPSRLTRERFVSEMADSDPSPPSARARPWDVEPALGSPVRDAGPPPDARDVLRMLHSNELTHQQAEAEIEALLLSQPAGAHGSEWGRSLALSAPEAAAYSQGAGAADLLALRYGAWPSSCVNCGQRIDYQHMRWWFVRDEQGRPGLRHVDCPPKPG